MFSEEKNSGTLELLLSRPLTDMQIILSKFFAGLTLVLFSIIPTFLYFLSIYLLGDPVGSIDSGGTWGSYIGLFFLAAIYASIGIFSSSLTSNQIIAFLISASLAFFLYLGFDFIASTFVSGEIEYIILQIGINKHYESMSRGVIDSRDIIYFLSTIGIFLFATKAVIQSRNN
jgi:ABC-2 type transport system permease protein